MSHLVPGLPFPDIPKEQWETLTQQQSVHPRRPESLTLDYSDNTLHFNCSSLKAIQEHTDTGYLPRVTEFTV